MLRFPIAISFSQSWTCWKSHSVQKGWPILGSFGHSSHKRTGCPSKFQHHVIKIFWARNSPFTSLWYIFDTMEIILDSSLLLVIWLDISEYILEFISRSSKLYTVLRYSSFRFWGFSHYDRWSWNLWPLWCSNTMPNWVANTKIGLFLF